MRGVALAVVKSGYIHSDSRRAAVLSGSLPTVVGTNSVPVQGHLGFIAGGATVREESATLPEGTSAIRLSLGANVGPRVAVTALAGTQVIARGERAAGWGFAESVTVPVKSVPRTTSNTRICITLGPDSEEVRANGAVVGGAGRFRVEYLRTGHRSWWSRASSVGTAWPGHAATGTWVVFLVAALMTMVAVLATRLLLREPDELGPAVRAASLLRRIRPVLQRIPRAAWICALIAFMNAACWSILTPPFQAPDEPAHFAYVQQLAENGRLPLPPNGKAGYSEEETVVLRDLRHLEVRWHPENHAITSQAEQRRLQEPSPTAAALRGRTRWQTRATALRAPNYPLWPGLGRHAARPLGAHEAAVRADGGTHRAIRLPVRPRGPPGGLLGLDRRRPGCRAGAAARVHVWCRQPRRDAVRRVRRDLLPARQGVSATR